MVLSKMRPEEVREGSEIPAKGRLDASMMVVGRGWWQMSGGSHASHDFIMPSVAARVEHLAVPS